MIPYNLKINGVEEDGATSIADINSDGILDVVVSSPSQNNNAILYAFT